MRFLDLEKTIALQYRALQSGGRATGPVYPWSHSPLPSSVEWNIAGNCTAPVIREVRGRKEVRNNGLNVQRSASVLLTVKCRKCEKCLARRASHWRYRAANEISQAERTWFCTFTMSPLEHGLAPFRARKRYAAKFPSEKPLGTASEFGERVSDMGSLLTNYFKRLRKETGVRLRYLLVAESHKNGLPHFHALIHECDPEGVRYRDLKDQWPHGFSQFKLVNDKYRAASYVAKYISKAGVARMRASLGYGRIRPERSQSKASVSEAWAAKPRDSHSMTVDESLALLRDLLAKANQPVTKRSNLCPVTSVTSRPIAQDGPLTFTTTLAGETSLAEPSIYRPATIQAGDKGKHPPVRPGGIVRSVHRRTPTR